MCVCSLRFHHVEISSRRVNRSTTICYISRQYDSTLQQPLVTQLYFSWPYGSNEPRHMNNRGPKRKKNNLAKVGVSAVLLSLLLCSITFLKGCSPTDRVLFYAIQLCSFMLRFTPSYLIMFWVK